jgi:K+ transporter
MYDPTSLSNLISATLKKFTTGAWFPFTVAVIMTTFMSFWRWGMVKKRDFEWENRVRLGELLRREGDLPTFRVPGEGAFILGSNRPTPPKEKAITTTVENVNSEKPEDNTPAIPSDNSSISRDSMAIHPVKTSEDSSKSRRRHSQQLYLRASDTPVYRIPGISIFYTGAPTSGARAPHTFAHFLDHFPAMHSTCIFLHVRTAAQPHVTPNQRLMLEPSPVWEGVWRGVYRIGYMEIPDFTASEFTLTICEKLGMDVERLTHVLQNTQLRGRREKEKLEVHWIKKVPERIRAWLIDTAWSGVDEVIGGVGKGWKVPVGEVLSVGSVAEV